MAHLYINAKGFEVRSHSYSAGSLFHECAQKYKLARLDGWKEREQRASQQFGIALEEAIRVYHQLDLGEALAHFQYLWSAQQNAELKYTATEGDWFALKNSGLEMLRLYDLRLPLFPIDPSDVKFQIKYWKELFPGDTNLSGIEFVAFIDMVTRSRATLGDPMIVDIKTSAKPFDSTPGMISLDQQLKSYAWVTGVSDVAFLNFIKTGRSLERGTDVAVLEAVGEFAPGQSAVVIKYQEYEPPIPAQPADPGKPKSKPKPAIPAVPEETWIVDNEEKIEEMFKACGKGQTKDEKEARENWIHTNATLVNKSILTKQRIQFLNGFISQEDQLDAAKIIGHDVAKIVYANQENFWPKEGGLRFPNDKCVRCQFRGNCLTNTQLRDTLVFRSDEEWDVPQEIEES